MRVQAIAVCVARSKGVGYGELGIEIAGSGMYYMMILTGH